MLNCLHLGSVYVLYLIPARSGVIFSRMVNLFLKCLNYYRPTNIKKSHSAVTYVATQHQGRYCKRLKLLRKAGRLQLIQNLVPSVAGWRQCYIRIAVLISYIYSKVDLNWCNFLKKLVAIFCALKGANFVCDRYVTVCWFERTIYRKFFWLVTTQVTNIMCGYESTFGYESLLGTG